ncbi:TetR family transcriptional regulator [Bacillus sp. J14TS2]|uniref:TetR/AcrR family transcriptional regulator n=1 Tax=Bacillus sp. J14TS2 TaxID=2807188 RepID=UPI001B0FEDAD|nr:TetR/AcrR family transcriptional regulator [Bacillus sp. J14TS2]GIN73884.1 TetR family transcriptional regulator [Bacillus sp. J14TS2]
MANSVDLRIKKTRRFLRNALIELINEKGFDSITIGDLAERAEINRVTFYKHYKDKLDLLDQNIEEITSSFVEVVAPNNREDLITEGKESSPIFLRLFEYISNNATFFQVMLGKNGISSFRNRLLKIIQQFMSEKLEIIHPNPHELGVPKEIFIHYISSAHLGVIIYWLETDLIYSPAYMAKQLSYLTVEGPISAIGLAGHSKEERT